ncbi:hypothetical protein SAMN05216509_2074 [Pseudomonas sp. B10]|uniref:hypothetical protein n=1 Tax=Pseudomonas sp. B10 TaxID=118613 RepID=UPI0009538ED0|nr:hypothetical protein [Pseudomonas sp. B10]SIR41302.1 hypothetical protein SAMN05216509_2074 [Pseudomonas sp. B10]
MKKIITSCALPLALSAFSAHAVNQEIRALFQPDPAQPSKNTFVNKTPNSGFCVVYPAQCADSNMFSIEVPVRYTSHRNLIPGDGVTVQVPANWRRLTVTNQDTGQSEVVEVRITGVGSTFHLSERVQDLTGIDDTFQAHDRLWTSDGWLYPPAPCRNSPVSGVGEKTYRFFWHTPLEAMCLKRVALPIPAMWFEKLDFSYELKTPNPMGMSSGLYSGSISYSMGPGGDFHLGYMMYPDDSNLTLDFVLDVQHTLKVDLPPGGNNVTLEPEGGWRPWIESGRKPTKIFRDQPFFISASSRFKVMLLCSSPGGNFCKLGSPQGNWSDFQVSMTLPPGITQSDGSNVTRVPLRFNNWIGPFEPGLYVDRKPGVIHFDMTSYAINFLLKPGLNDRLRGNVTIIWDSEA